MHMTLSQICVTVFVERVTRVSFFGVKERSQGHERLWLRHDRLPFAIIENQIFVYSALA